MSSIVFNVFKGQRIDINAQMKDADRIIEAFRKHHIRFSKKYTSINTKGGPSTITFKDIRSENCNSDIAKMIVDIQGQAEKEEIGNVYIRFTTFSTPKVAEDTNKT